MAEGLFRQMVRERSDIVVGSAGVGAAVGQTPSPPAILALKPLGIDIAHYRSRLLTASLVEKATYIFAMTRMHLSAIQMMFPHAAEKTFLVCEFDEELSRVSIDIPDPIGQGLETYARCRDVLKKALPGILTFIDQADHYPSMTPPISTSSKPLRIALGADHGGIGLKKKIHDHLTGKGFVVSDLGAFSTESVDYPDYAEAVCREIISDQCDYGVLVCKTGIGMSIAANRYPQIRASLVASEEEAKITRLHNNSNVLCLAGKALDESLTFKIIDTYLKTPFEGGRHERRVEKLEHLAAPCYSNQSLAEVDPEISAAIDQEAKRQFENIELIASENFTSRAVMEAQGSVLTNKYAEGYPGRRWYGGCEHVDVVEQLAIDRAKLLFGARTCQRPAAQRQPGKYGGLFQRPAAGRQNPDDGSRPWRPSHPWTQGEFFGALITRSAIMA